MGVAILQITTVMSWHTIHPRHYETKVTNIIPRCPLYNPLSALWPSLVLPVFFALLVLFGPLWFPWLVPSIVFPGPLCMVSRCLVPSDPLWSSLVSPCLISSGPLLSPLVSPCLTRDHRHKQSLLRSISRLLHVPSISLFVVFIYNQSRVCLVSETGFRLGRLDDTTCRLGVLCELPCGTDSRRYSSLQTACKFVSYIHLSVLIKRLPIILYSGRQ